MTTYSNNIESRFTKVYGRMHTCDNQKNCEEFENAKYICNQLDAIIDNSYDGIYITDGQANTILVNKAYEEITGVLAKDVIGKNMSDIVKDGIISKSGTLMVLESKKSVTIEQTFKNGKTVLISSNPVFDDGEISMVVTNVRDITKLYELQEKLRQSEETSKRYHSEIESIKSQSLTNMRIITDDAKTREILKNLKRVAPLDFSVLLLGESGVGKEVFSRYIYENSARKDKYFFKVNCGAIPVNLIESQLFGYEQGSFSGADKKGRMGIFETANGGTVFLDEIGELPIDMQVKFLRVLQENEIVRVGGTESIPVNVRIIAATNRDLKEMVKKKLFREDLYYRLNVLPFTIPPLRERKGDIELLAHHFIQELNQRLGFNKKLSDGAIQALNKYNWPGNIRELKNIIERIAVMSDLDTIHEDDLPVDFEIAMSLPSMELSEDMIPLDKIVARYELKMMEKAYERFGNVRDAAAFLGMHPSTFVRKRQKHKS